jgi:murein DD-endopeptidase MepM/ murein hydrolase activator NlpD
VPCAENDNVYSLVNGVVENVFGGENGEANVLIAFVYPSTGETWLAQYGHLNSAEVSRGDAVSAGTLIGACGDKDGADPGDFHVHNHIYRALPPGEETSAPECDGDGDPPDDEVDATSYEFMDPEVVHASCPS